MEAVDGQWGEVFPNGSVTGMIGVVARREADFAVNEITITGTHSIPSSYYGRRHCYARVNEHLNLFICFCDSALFLQ